MKAKKQAKQRSKDKANEHNKPITSKRKQNKAIKSKIKVIEPFKANRENFSTSRKVL